MHKPGAGVASTLPLPSAGNGVGATRASPGTPGPGCFDSEISPSVPLSVAVISLVTHDQ